MIREFIRSGSSVFVADLAGKSLGFLLIAGLTYLLSPAELGKYNAFVTAAASICLFSGWGVPIVLQRMSAVDKSNRGKELGQMIFSGLMIMLISIILVLGVLFFIGADTWQVVFNDLDKEWLVWLPVLVLCYFFVQSPLSVILGLGLFRAFSLRTVFEAGITLICVLVGAVIGGLLGALAGLSIALGVTSVITFFVLKNALATEGISLSSRDILKNSKQILGDAAVYYVGNTLLGAVASVLMIALFTRHVGYTELGYLRVALSIAAIMNVIPHAVRTVTVTFIARNSESSAYLKSLQIRYLIVIIVIFTVLLNFFLYPIVSILFGNNYLEGIFVYKMVLFLYVILNIQLILNGFTTGHGHLKYSGMINTIMVLIYMALMYFLIPAIGSMGYFVGFGLSYLIGVLILMVHEINESQFENAVLLRKVIIVALVTISAMTVCTILHLNESLQLLIESLLLVMYIIWNFRYAFKKDELEKIVNMFKIRFGLN